MDCRTVRENLLASWGDEPPPFLARLAMAAHLLVCPACAREAERLAAARAVMKTDFFPEAPGLEEPVMALLARERSGAEEEAAPGGVSTRGWVITGLVVLFSLTGSFFGLDFIKIADSHGAAFLLPVGLTFGLVFTCYGALFIGSHLKELTARFKLKTPAGRPAGRVFAPDAG